MASLIKGEAVIVYVPPVEYDELGEPTYGEPEPQTVGNVVVAPGATADLDASRPDGASVAFTLCFPKTFKGSLKGRTVEVRGDEYKVVGNPQRYSEANTPNDWNLTVEVGHVEG